MVTKLSVTVSAITITKLEIGRVDHINMGEPSERRRDGGKEWNGGKMIRSKAKHTNQSCASTRKGEK